MARFCTHCGAPMGDNVKFCTNCGAGAPHREPAQPAAPRPVFVETSSNGGVITLLLVIIVLLVAGGSYLYFTNQQEAQQPEPATAQPVAVAAQEQPSREQTQAAQRKIYIGQAVSLLAANEDALADLASTINSGRYDRSYLLNYEANTMNAIKNRRQSWQSDNNLNDNALVNEIDTLFSMQIKRADCMRQGIQGDTAQYAVGGQYYDQFQSHFADLKSRYGL